LAEIVNLRMARKQRRRMERERAAEENRTRHGIPPAERAARKAEAERQRNVHEDHRREGPPGETK
jgi:hypothetical protein